MTDVAGLDASFVLREDPYTDELLFEFSRVSVSVLDRVSFAQTFKDSVEVWLWKLLFTGEEPVDV